MFYEASFHDGPTQKSIKQRPDRCSQPEPPGPRPDQASKTNWLGSQIENWSLFGQNAYSDRTFSPELHHHAQKLCWNWIKELRKVVFFPVRETFQESKAEFSFKIHTFRFFVSRPGLAWPVLTNLELGQANGGVRVWSEDHCIRTNNTIFISI